MSAPNTLNWIRVGLLALPIYGLLTAWSTLDPQPDSSKHPEAWSRFVGSTSSRSGRLVSAYSTGAASVVAPKAIAVASGLMNRRTRP